MTVNASLGWARIGLFGPGASTLVGLLGVLVVACDGAPLPTPTDATSADGGAETADAAEMDAASEPSDAGGRVDAAAPPDAGDDGDAGEIDAGDELDASDVDASVPSDAGHEDDAALPLDASPPPDAACAGPEIPGDGIDSDCDGRELCYRDFDGDGHRALGGGTIVSEDLACDGPGEASAAQPADDCHDVHAFVHPGAAEVCDGYDDDCDGVMLAGEEDEGDGYLTCAGFVDRVLTDEIVGTGDCDTLDPMSFRLADLHRDGDLDAFGVGPIETICTGATTPAGHSDVATDCDDADPFVYPGAPEIPADGIVQDCAGSADLVPDEVSAVYVDQACVSPCGAGTRASPVRTIAAGIAMAGTTRVVVVAEGTYAEELTTRTSLFGGYRGDWAVRDPAVHVTRIEQSTRVPLRVAGRAVVSGFTIVQTSGGSAVSLGAGSDATLLDDVIEATGATTRAVVVLDGPVRARGNVLRATSTTTTGEAYGVEVRRAGHTYFEDNVIEAHTTSSATAIAVYSYLRGTMGIFVGNVIRGGSSAPAASDTRPGYGVEWVDPFGRGTAWLHLEGNDIRGGDREDADAVLMMRSRLVAVGNRIEAGVGVDRAYGLHHFGATHTTAINNFILGGTATHPTSGESIAILAPTHGLFVNNTIIAGSARTTRGVRSSGGGRTVWIDNLIGSGAGVSSVALDLSRGGSGVREVILHHNDLYGAAIAQLVYASSGLTTPAAVDACLWTGCVSATGTVSVTPAYVGGSPFDHHVTATIPGAAPGALYSGTLDDVDIDGDPRPGADGVYGLGADELP